MCKGNLDPAKFQAPEFVTAKMLFWCSKKHEFWTNWQETSNDTIAV